jgi:hypothetical protein
MDTALSVGLQHASLKFTMCRSCHISYSQRIPLLPFRSEFSRKDNGCSSCEYSRIVNKSFPASRNVTMSHRLCLLPVTGNYLSDLITLIILKLVHGSGAVTVRIYVSGNSKINNLYKLQAPNLLILHSV